MGATSLLGAVLAGQTGEIACWLSAADSVVALLMDGNGAIRWGNPAAARLFAPVADLRAGSIYDHVTASGADCLRQRITDGSGPARFLLNLTMDGANPITVEACLLRCDEGVALLGGLEQRDAQRLPSELYAMNNELAALTRELARTNAQLKRAQRQLEQVARTDGLTGVLNRRALDEVLALEIARAERQPQVLTIVMCDIDHFKRLNDRYGHQTGDQLLALMGGLCGEVLRPYDAVGRYGGDEFVVVLPGSDCADGISIAERLRSGFESAPLGSAAEPHTLSLGVASWTSGERPENFVARADQALYCAKLAGRNRVEVQPKCAGRPTFGADNAG